jgi:hypothetical protein
MEGQQRIRAENVAFSIFLTIGTDGEPMMANLFPGTI